MDLYSFTFLKEIEDDDKKCDNFNKYVLPSLSNHQYACLFDGCMKKSFATKQSLCRHLQKIHKDELPGGGLFLTPNSSYSLKQTCQFCKKEFSRKDKLQYHLKNDQLCSIQYNEILNEKNLDSSDKKFSKLVRLTQEIKIDNEKSVDIQTDSTSDNYTVFEKPIKRQNPSECEEKNKPKLKKLTRFEIARKMDDDLLKSGKVTPPIFSKLEDISNNCENKKLNFYAVISNMDLIKKVNTRDHQQIDLLNIYVNDTSDCEFRMAFWGNVAQKFRYGIGTILMVLNVELKMFNGIYYLNTNKDTMHMEIEESFKFTNCEEIRKWWKERKKNLDCN